MNNNMIMKSMFAYMERLMRKLKHLSNSGKSAVWDGCRSVSYKWMDQMDWKSPGGVKYRSAYAANNL